MKKSFLLLAAALFTFVGCYKETPETTEVINPEEGQVILTFTSEKPELEVEDPTKTAWDASLPGIVWSENDKIRVGYTLDGEWMGKDAAGDAKFYASDPVSIDENNSSIGNFSVPGTFTDPKTEGVYKFFAVYPSTLVESTVETPAAQVITIKENQNPGTNTFDSSADVLLGQSKELSLSGLPTDPISLTWKRVVAHAALTFSNVKDFGSDETVSKITLTFNEDAKVTGDVTANIQEGTVGTGSSNVVVLENGFTVDGANISVWACVLPVTFTSLDVEIKTNAATYTRSITGISKTFKQNARNRLGIKMESAERTASEQSEWVKKDLSAITSSDVFVIVGNNGSNYAMSNSNGTSSAPAAIAVTVTDDKLATAPADNIQWTLSVDNGNYTFYPNGTTESWLYCTNTNNGVRVGTNTAKVFTIDGGYLKHTSTSRYVGVYNSTDWRCYTTNTGTSNIANQTFAFYVKTAASETKPAPTIDFGTPTTEVSIGETVTNVATIDPSTLSVTYSSSNDDIATVDENGTVTGVAIGTATITASFAGDETYDAASANYEITVVDPEGNDGSAEKPYTASEAITVAASLGTNTKDVYVKGIVCTTGSVNTQYNSVTYYISDDGSSTSRLQIYSGKYIEGANFTDDNNLKLGDYVVVYGTLKLYNNTTPEIDKNSEIQSIFRAPTFAPDGGSFSTDNTTVTISAETGATIRYTLDGTIPTTSTGAVYNGPITITETTTIKAIAIKDDLATGASSATFTKTSSSDILYSLYSGDLTEGDYVVVYNNYAMKNTVSSNRLGYAEVTISGNDIANPDASIVWHIAPNGDYWTIYNAAVEKYAAGNGTRNQAALNDSSTADESLWTVSGNETYEFVNKKNAANNVNKNLRNNGTYGFACYGTGTGGALSLYKKN